MAKKNVLTKSKIKKAQQFLGQNQFNEALELYQQVCESDKSDLESKLTLAMINRRLGFYTKTADCCTEIIKINPGHAQAWHVLGTAFHYQGDLAEAINCYSKAINIQPDLFESYYLSANAYRESGDLTNAVFLYNKAIKLKPDYLEALANLGAALLQLENFDEAWSVLKKAFALKSDTVQVLCSMAAVLIGYRRPDDALQYILRAQNIDPSFYDVNRLLGSIHKELGNYDNAIESYQKILSNDPSDELAIVETALIYERQGRYQDAFSLIKPLLDNKTLNHSALIIFSKLSGKIDQPDISIELIEEVLKTEKNSNIDTAELHYELGRRYDKNSQFDLSFKHYQLANDEVRKKHLEVADKNIVENYTSLVPQWLPDNQSDFFNINPSSTCSSQQPIFIVGMLRSGTTLTEQILSSHTDIQAGGELFGQQSVNSILKLDAQVNVDYFQAHKEVDIDELNHAADCYLNKINNLPEHAARIIDSVRTQLDYFSVIARVFPKAHVIYTTRAPLDNCLSIYFQNLGATPSLIYSSDLLEIGKTYIHYKNLMNYYKKHLNINIIEIKYEDLATNLEEISKTMIEFCGLEWDARCLNFHKTERNVITPSYDQVRQPIYTKSIQRWKNYKNNLEPLIELLRENEDIL